MERPIKKLRQFQEDIKMPRDKKQILIDSLSKLSTQELQTAYLYAINYVKYGADVTKVWDTAIQNTCALERAYQKGYYDGLKQANEWENE